MRPALLLFVAAACTAAPAPILCEGGGCEPPELVVDVAWLRTALAGRELLQVIDVRPAGEFAVGHVPGALSLDVEALRATVDGVEGQVAAPEAVEAALRAAGVRRGARLVVLGAEAQPEPARVVWTLQHHGHASVHLLQGGWTAWSGVGERSTEVGAAAPGDLVVGAPSGVLRVDAAWVLAHLDDPAVALVDARSAEEFAAGHIPGARHVDWHANVVDGHLLGREELAQLYEGLDPERTVVTYCKSGMRASLSYLVLRELGFADVRLYDGSWNEWGAQPRFPQEM